MSHAVALDIIVGFRPGTSGFQAFGPIIGVAGKDLAPYNGACRLSIAMGIRSGKHKE